MVFQNYALYPYLTVAQNIAFPLKMAGVKKAEREQQAREVARLLGLEEYLQRKPAQLSGGQRQRVAMGRAIVRQPSVFLMDEPLSNLDAKLRVQMRADIAALQADFGITTVYVTHDQSEAMTLGHRVAVLDDGRLQQCGTPRALYDRPANIFVAGFIGSPAMNLVRVPLAANGSIALGSEQVDVGEALTAEARANGRDGVVLGLRPEALELGTRRPARAGRGGRGARRGRLRLLLSTGARRVDPPRREDRGARCPGSRCRGHVARAARRGASVRRRDRRSPRRLSPLEGPPRRLLEWLGRARGALRPPSRPLRVLDPRRRVPHPGARGAGGRARDAGRRRSPTTARSPARSSSTGRPASTASSRFSAARSTSPTTGAPRRRATPTSRCSPRTTTGYANLIKLASAGYLEGYYYKPRVDWELLERHSQGLIALSGCLSGRVCKALEENRGDDARRDLDRLAQIFGRDSTYVEMQNARPRDPARINPLLAKLAEETGLPLVATGDVHYLRHEDARAHEALLCIQSGDSLKNPNHWKFDTDQFYFKSPAEMALDFPGYDDAMRRTLEVAERCNVEIELGKILLPKFPMPEGSDAFDYLVELCEKGLREALRQGRRRSSRSGSSSSSRRSGRWASPTTS